MKQNTIYATCDMCHVPFKMILIYFIDQFIYEISSNLSEIEMVNCFTHKENENIFL